MPAGIETVLAEVLSECAPLDGGHVATYIPELARVNPDLFGIAACTVEGEVVSAGDSEVPFSLQSTSKPFLYATALERFGEEAVSACVGVEPSGDAFDAIVRLDERTHRPDNAMVNAGAIAIAGMFEARTPKAPVKELRALFAAFAGRRLDVDLPVQLSERGTAHRNRAIAHLMRHFGVLEGDVEESLELYFYQCATLVTCRDLAVMAATLAAGGTNPLTGERILSTTTVEKVLAVLSTCGLYDASGRFAFQVGLPAKSGVSGGLFMVVPGRLALALFSPRLDEEGNSVRGLAAARSFCERSDLHGFGCAVGVGAVKSSEEEMSAALRTAHEQGLATDGGEVAEYLPASPTDADALALAICTVDGREVSLGEVDARFSLQAAANPFAYAYVAEKVGTDAILSRCGVEPSGNPFHAIVFDPRTNKPYNPLGNAGAMVVSSLAPGEDEAGRLDGMLDFLGGVAGGATLRVDASVLEAEDEAADRNRAIASLLRGCGVVEDEDAALDLYLQQCSISVDAMQLARMGATLAACGVSPATGRTWLSPRTVRETLSLMYTCGLHDDSGRFAFEVGLPAKSGISGAIVAVCPGRMGVVAWSPAVNERGTSVRAYAALGALAKELGLGRFSAEGR